MAGRMNKAQLEQIELGKEAGIDYNLYNKKEFNWMQMEEIRKGLLEGVNAYLYADPTISESKMKVYREFLCNATIQRIFQSIKNFSIEQLVEIDNSVKETIKHAIDSKMFDYDVNGMVDKLNNKIKPNTVKTLIRIYLWIKINSKPLVSRYNIEDIIQYNYDEYTLNSLYNLMTVNLPLSIKLVDYFKGDLNEIILRNFMILHPFITDNNLNDYILREEFKPLFINRRTCFYISVLVRALSLQEEYIIKLANYIKENNIENLEQIKGLIGNKEFIDEYIRPATEESINIVSDSETKEYLSIFEKIFDADNLIINY